MQKDVANTTAVDGGDALYIQEGGMTAVGGGDVRDEMITEPMSPEAVSEAKAALNRIFDQIFTKAYLEQDEYLQNVIAPNLTLPFQAVVEALQVRQITQDPNVIRAALDESSMVTLEDPSNAGQGITVKLNIKLEQNTIILRDIPQEAKEEDIRTLIAKVPNCPEIVSVRADIGNTWFVVFNNEEDAKTILGALSTLKYNDKPIKGRLKTESIKKSFFTSPIANGAPGTGAPGTTAFFPSEGQMPMVGMPGFHPYFPGYMPNHIGPGGPKYMYSTAPMQVMPSDMNQPVQNMNHRGGGQRRGGKAQGNTVGHHRGIHQGPPGQPGQQFYMQMPPMPTVPVNVQVPRGYMPRPQFMVPHNMQQQQGAARRGDGNGYDYKMGKGQHKQRMDGSNMTGQNQNRHLGGQGQGGVKSREGQQITSDGSGEVRKQKKNKNKKGTQTGEDNGNGNDDLSQSRRNQRNGELSNGRNKGGDGSQVKTQKGKKAPNFNMEADFPTLGDGDVHGTTITEVDVPTATSSTQTSPKAANANVRDWAAALKGGIDKSDSTTLSPDNGSKSNRSPNTTTDGTATRVNNTKSTKDSNTQTPNVPPAPKGTTERLHNAPPPPPTTTTTTTSSTTTSSTGTSASLDKGSVSNTVNSVQQVTFGRWDKDEKEKKTTSNNNNNSNSNSKSKSKSKSKTDGGPPENPTQPTSQSVSPSTSSGSAWSGGKPSFADVMKASVSK
jgi:hypothetical protein